MRPILIGAFGPAFIAAGAHVAADASHVTASLVVDAQQITPGTTFTLGVLLEPEPGWHVYWRNPGEAGLATQVAFDLPEGLEVGELGWPVPVTFEQPGGIVGYGYEDEVVLAAPVSVPDGTTGSVPAKVEVSWLACKDVCVLGKAELEAELPLGEVERDASRAALKSWRQSLPRNADGTRFSASVTGGPVPVGESAELALWLNWAGEAPEVEFYPDPGPGLKVEKVRTRTRGRLTRVDFEITRLRGTADPASSLPSVVVTTDDAGKRSGSSLEVNLK
jgi:DsbC/DsbD-like thiol-disulfide interchange protein